MNIKTTNRDIELLSPVFKNKVKSFLRECPQIFITEAYRSQERQDYLYSLGRTIKGAIVTWTKTSEHTRGNAIDIAFYGNDLYPRDINKWKEIVDIANNYDISWGYDLWGCDKPHFQNNDNIPSFNQLTNYKMEKQFQNIIKNKLCDSIAGCLSVLWNFISDTEEQKRIELIKKEILNMKDE